MIKVITDYSKYIVKPKRLAKRSILLKGASGTGKSYQFRKLVQGGWKGLYVCTNEHLGTVADLDEDTWLLKQLDIPLSPTAKDPEHQDFMALMDYLRFEDHEYDFVFLDSLMNYVEALEAWLKHTEGKDGFELWGLFGEKAKMLMKLFVSLTDPTSKRPVHVIGTWGVGIGQDWEGKRQTQPIVSGKVVGPRIDYFFDDVFMLGRNITTEGKEEYVMHTKATHEFSAKVSAADVDLPPVIADPNLHTIITFIQTNQEQSK